MYIMKRYEVVIKRGRRTPDEHRIMRANNINSLIGMAQDMMKEDDSINAITIMGLTYKEYEVVER